MAAFRNCARALGTKVHARLTKPSSWILPREESSIAPPGVWSNKGMDYQILDNDRKSHCSLSSLWPDYDPVEAERRTWTSTTIATYWFSDLVSIVGWSQAAAMYRVGLSATDATLACMVAGICIGVPTGRTASSVSFPEYDLTAAQFSAEVSEPRCISHSRWPSEGAMACTFITSAFFRVEFWLSSGSGSIACMGVIA